MAKAANKSSVTIPSQERGSLFVQQHCERPMRVYPVYENELRTVSILNRVTGLFSSLALGSAGTAWGIWLDFAKDEVQTAMPHVVKMALVQCGIFTVACAGVAYWAHRVRKSELHNITDSVTNVENKPKASRKKPSRAEAG